MFRIMLIGVQDYGVSDRSLALDCLAGSLRRHVTAVVQTEDLARRSFDEVDEALRQFKPDLVGLSVRPGGAAVLERVVASVRKRVPDARLVLGGQTPTISPVECVGLAGEAVAVVGEGEEALTRLARKWCGQSDEGLEEIPNLVFRRGKDVVRTRWRAVPAQYLEYADDEAVRAIGQGSVIWAEGSRGCGSRCTFCTVHLNHGERAWRSLPAELVVDHLARLRALGATSVSLADFNAVEDDTWGEELGAGLERADLKLAIRLDTRADAVWNARDDAGKSRRRREMWRRLRRVGVRQVFIGFESGSEVQLRRWGKGTGVSAQVRALRRLERLGIDFVLGYIGLDPVSDLSAIEDSVEWLLKSGFVSRVTSPLKELRVQRATVSEQVMRRAGLLRDLQPNLLYYDCDYRDAPVSTVANVARYFHRTSAKVYHHSYLTSTLRAGAPDAEALIWMERFNERFKLFEAELLRGAVGRVRHSDRRGLIALVQWAVGERLRLFAELAGYYEGCLRAGWPHFREDFRRFCERLEEPAQFNLAEADHDGIVNGTLDYLAL